MKNLLGRTDLPVLMLSNADCQWPLEDTRESIVLTENLVSALQEIGHPVSYVYVETNNLPDLLLPYSAKELVVFNWCEELPGVLHSAPMVAQEFERCGFTFNGADSDALALSQDKRRVKRRLQKHGIPTLSWQVFISVLESDWSQFPAIVRPAYEHCSYGITREAVVQSSSELMQRVKYVLEELQ